MKELLPSAQADARIQDVRAILQESLLEREAVNVLNEIAQRLLSSTRTELLAHALRRIFDVVAAAQRVTVVAWPPHPQDGFRPLLPEDVLRREGIPESPVSTSMARHAVDSRQALYFVGQSEEHVALRHAPSVLANRIHSAVYVPLMGGADEVLALLCVDTPQPSEPILPNDFPFIRAVGALLSAALGAERIREEAHLRQMEAREQEVRRDALANCMRIASHDLKNPLVVIQLASQMMAKNDDRGRRDGFLQQVRQAVKRSTRLIDTYLEAAEALTGRTLKAHRSEVDPKALIDDEIAFLQMAHEGVIIENRVGCRHVHADVEKLRQIFANLLSNACKYSPADRAVTVGSSESDDGVTFTVRDQGVGISTEDQARLFGAFQRVGDTRATEGTGLGLWITQALVNAHGGRIWVESVPQQGSTFAFFLPRG